MGLRARLQQLISSLAADNDLISIHIVDKNNMVLASSRLADVGLSWQTLQQDFQQPLVENVRRTQRLASYHDVEQDFLETYASLYTVDRNDEISDLGHSINSLLDEIVEDEKAIRDGHERLHALFDNVIDSVIVINEQGIIEQANPATEQIFGYTPEEVIGQNVSMLMPEQTRSEHDRYLSNYCETGVKNTIGIGRQVEALHISGMQFPVELTISEMHVHGERLFTVILRDISEQVAMRQQMEKAYEDLSEAHARLEQSARTDKLTELYNRGYFDAVLYTETMRATRYDEPLSLMLLDVDYFKPYNDHYGHPEGDNCLKVIAQLIKEVFLRSGEVVARYGGEEFAVILPHVMRI
jgi:PAS domain S-box-containing protein